MQLGGTWRITGVVYGINQYQAVLTSAKNVAESINESFGRNTAKAVDAVSVRVGAPCDPAKSVEFLSVLENLDIQEGDGKAKIAVNSRTGTIVIGGMVRLKPVAVTHGGLTVTVTEDQQVSQPNSFSMGQTAIVPNSNIQVTEKPGRMFKFDTGTTLDDLVRAVIEMGPAPGDLMSVLEALEQAGAIEGELVVILLTAADSLSSLTRPVLPGAFYLADRFNGAGHRQFHLNFPFFPTQRSCRHERQVSNRIYLPKKVITSL